MAKKNTSAGLLGMLGNDPGQQASTLQSLGTMGVVRLLTQAADQRVAAHGGAPWTPSLNRAKRQAAATVRRRAPRGSVTRSAARSVAAGSRPNAVQRRAMRRDSYRLQGEKLTPDQLMAIPASDLPPELVRRKRDAQRQADESQSTAAASVGTEPPQATKSHPAAGIDQKIQAQLRAIIGDPQSLPPEHRAQLERQLAEKFGHSSPSAGPAPSDHQTEPTEQPQPTPAQRKQENVQAVVDAQLEDAPQPRQEQPENSGGWLDKLQMGLDVAGAAEPTPFADGTNAVISLGRAVTDRERRGEHLQNAAISTVSAAVPYIGDAAKLLKVGRAAKKARAASGAGRVATREGTQGTAAVAVSSVRPAAHGGIGNTIRRKAGGAIGSMFSGGDRHHGKPTDSRRDSGVIDKVQAGLDVVGAADPTPITDWVNGAISLGRAAVDPRRRGEHLQNAAISAVSGAVPYAGDSAKLLKLGRSAEKMDGARGAGRGAAKGAERASARDGVAGPAFSGGGASPPSEPPRFGAPSPAPGNGGDNVRRRREEAAGIAAHDQWTDKLKAGALSMASFVGKTYLAVEGLQLFNRGVMTLNRDLAQYSGPLAGAYAKADNADIRRDMKRANALSGPLSRLQDETSELQDSISEMVTPIHGVLIEILAAITKTANFGVDIAKNTTHIGILVDIYNWLMGVKEDDAPGARQFLQDLSDGKFDGFGIDDVGKRFEILDKATRSQMGLTAQPKKPQKGKAPAPP